MRTKLFLGIALAAIMAASAVPLFMTEQSVEAAPPTSPPAPPAGANACSATSGLEHGPPFCG